MLEMLRDVLLFQGLFGWMFWLTGIGFCMANCRIILQAKPQIRFLHGLAMGVLGSYGGSTLAAAMLAKPTVFLINESLVPMFFCVWCVMYTLPSLFLGLLKDTSVGSIFASCCYEIFRCHVMINCAKMAHATLTVAAFPLTSTPTVGPLICGMLGGCGGGFFPLDKGLGPIEKDTNWRITSAIFGSIWLQLMISDPTVKPYLAGTMLADPAWVRFCAVFFFAAFPLLQALMPGFNPLGNNPLVGAATVAVPAGKKTN